MSLKKILTKTLRPLKSLRFWKLASLFLAGLVVGALLTYYVGPKKQSSSSRSSASRQNRSSQKQADKLEGGSQKRLDAAYERAKKDIDKAEAAGRLNQEQLTQLKARLEEAKKFMQDHASGSSADREAIRKQKQAWREWAQQNKVSSSYLIRIYQ